MMQVIPKWKVTCFYDSDEITYLSYFIHASNFSEASRWFIQLDQGLKPINKVVFELISDNMQSFQIGEIK